MWSQIVERLVDHCFRLITNEFLHGLPMLVAGVSLMDEVKLLLKLLFKIYSYLSSFTICEYLCVCLLARYATIVKLIDFFLYGGRSYRLGSLEFGQ